jgi:hypothetical protein
MVRSLALCAIGVCLLAVATGCGSSSPTRTSEGASESQTAFVARANAACRRFQAKARRIGEQYPDAFHGPPPAQAAPAYGQFVTALHESEREFASLSPPSHLSRLWAEVRAAVRTQTSQLSSMAEAARAGDAAALSADEEAEQRLVSRQARLSAQELRLGLTACGGGT